MCYKYEKQFKKPVMSFVKSPNFSSRNSVQLKKIVCHYTTSDNANGVISWLTNPVAQVSAHYVIAKDGTVTQLVKDSDRAWHAYGNNSDSIGIEVCAKTGEKMTKYQDWALKDLCLYLLNEYPTIDLVTGHRFLYEDQGYTDCPSAIFGEANIDSLRVWISQNLKPDFPKLKLPS